MFRYSSRGWCSGVARVELVSPYLAKPVLIDCEVVVSCIVRKIFFHYNTLGAQEVFSWQFGLLTAYTGTA